MQTCFIKTPLGIAKIEGDANGISTISILDENKLSDEVFQSDSVGDSISDFDCFVKRSLRLRDCDGRSPTFKIKSNDLSQKFKNLEIINQAITQLQEYFDGNRNHFTFKINPRGTDFQ